MLTEGGREGGVPLLVFVVPVCVCHIVPLPGWSKVVWRGLWKKAWCLESIKHWGDNEKYALLLRVEVIQSVVVLRLLGQRVARFAEKTDLLAMLAPDNLTLHYIKVSAAWRAALDAQCTVGRTHCSESIFGHRKSKTASKSVKLFAS